MTTTDERVSEKRLREILHDDLQDRTISPRAISDIASALLELLARRSVEGGVPEGMVLVPREPLDELCRINDVILDLVKSGADPMVMEEELGEATAILIKAYRRASNDGSTK